MTHADEWVSAAASSQRWSDAVLDELWTVKRRINAEAGFDPALLHAQARAVAAAWCAERGEAGAGDVAAESAGGPRSDSAAR